MCQPRSAVDTEPSRSGPERCTTHLLSRNLRFPGPTVMEEKQPFYRVHFTTANLIRGRMRLVWTNKNVPYILKTQARSVYFNFHFTGFPPIGPSSISTCWTKFKTHLHTVVLRFIDLHSNFTCSEVLRNVNIPIHIYLLHMKSNIASLFPSVRC